MLLFSIRAILALLILSGVSRADPLDRPTTRSVHVVEGWNVQVDDRLAHGAEQALGEKTLTLLTADLVNIASQVPAEPLAHLRAVSIVVDLNHGSLDNMQYHPSAEWLKDHGFAAELAKCVHIPVAAQFADPRHRHAQPWCLLHELAHSYHDQVLGFEEPQIRALWEEYCHSGHGDSVLHFSGNKLRHYATTNQQEFFAEMSEAYVGMNDFYPFNRVELQEAEPQIFDKLRTIWGEPGR